MSILKCKMCGGDLEITAGETVVECEYCGSKQTIPNVDNEKKATLFSRANRLRQGCEFDKAYSVYIELMHRCENKYWEHQQNGNLVSGQKLAGCLRTGRCVCAGLWL